MRTRTLFLVMLAVTWPATLAADERPLDIRHMSVIAGEVGINDTLDGPQWYGIEFRGRPHTRWNLVPGYGVNWAANGAYYVFIDNRINYWVRERWLFSLYSGPGVFKRSRELDLGHTIEFRSGVEVAYRFDDDSRFGISWAHLSNASISDRNPGTEVLVLTYSRPR